MGAIQDITWTTGTSSGGTPNNLPCLMPASVAAGDLLVMCVWNANITPPTGWTLQASSNNVSDRTRLYTKTAVGTEGGTTVNCTERAGTVAGLNFVAAVVRLRFLVAPSAAYGGNQFGSAGVNPYTEVLGTPDLGTTYATAIKFHFVWDVGASASPTYTADGANALDLGSRDFLHSSTSANSATAHDRLIVVGYDNLTSTQSAAVAVTTTAAVDTVINGTSATFSAATPLAALPLPATGGGSLVSQARHMQFVNMPYEAHSAMLRRRGRRA